MKKPHYKYKRYAIQAKRKGTKGKWTEWTLADDYDDAVKHRNRAEELGYCARIIDKGEKENA